MCSNYPGIKLEPALQRLEDKIEHLSSYAHVVLTTVKQVISRRRKNENVCGMSKNEKCTCKGCKSIVFHCQICKFVTLLLPLSSWLCKLPIVGPNNVVSCWAMLAEVCKRSQQVATCWVFRCENKGLWDVFHLRRHFYFLFACIYVDTWHVVRVHRRNIVGCAVQTKATLLDHASITAKQYKSWHLLALKFDQFQTSFNNFQQVATTRKRSQQVGPNNVASVCTGLNIA